ncbi:MAG: GDP-mannose 4,6-dehydratase [Chloroflexi bacterium]|nr:GDP-mannose 4,6-dehydratase [Chloroflexota bacterium]
MGERALVTGVGGFVGRHLAAYLSGQGLDIFGAGRPSAQSPGDPLRQWYGCDLRDADQVSSVMREVEPDYVFHLAALIKGNSLADSIAVNVIGTQNVLEAVLAVRPDARVLVTGSAAEYGLALAGEQPIREDNPLRPVTAYGLSKVAQSLLAAQYTYNHGMAILRTRTFNLTGPGEPATLVCSAFAKQIASIELAGAPGIIRVGQLDTERDLLDIRDAVAAYWLVAKHGHSGEVYNVCSGASMRVREVLDILIGLARVPIAVEEVAPNLEGADVPTQRGSWDKLRRLAHWEPRIPLRRSLEALLNAWRMELTSRSVA